MILYINIGGNFGNKLRTEYFYTQNEYFYTKV